MGRPIVSVHNQKDHNKAVVQIPLSKRQTYQDVHSPGETKSVLIFKWERKAFPV